VVQDAPPSQARGKRRNRAFLSGQAGAMQAGMRELHKRREQRCKDNSCAQATKQLPCLAMLHAPRQPNGEQLHGSSLAKESLARPVRCRLGHAVTNHAPKRPGSHDTHPVQSAAENVSATPSNRPVATARFAALLARSSPRSRPRLCFRPSQLAEPTTPLRHCRRLSFYCFVAEE
jgi:hypothetical protein